MSKLIDRQVASTYYKTQKRFLTSYFEKAKTLTSQSVSISVKVVLADINKSVNACLDPSILTMPDASAFPKGSQVGATFKRRFIAFREHTHTGIIRFGMGEVFLCLEGDMMISGCAIGKFEGNLKKQLETLTAMSSKDMDTHCDFAYKFSVPPETGKGTILVLPPGSMYTMYSRSSVCLSWSFGASDVDSRRVVMNTLASLFYIWPQVNSGDYREFSEWLSKQ